MGTGYTRNDTANNIADGNVINASDLDGEFDAVQAAFNGTTGHSHDGTSGEGPQIDTAGIAADAIDGTKIADDSIDSEHYVDGSIDTAHIANDAVTGDKLANNIQIAGTLGVTGETTLSTHLNMGDNDKIKIGASADLEIYHDGLHSYISEQGTGNLRIPAANFNVRNAANNASQITAVDSAGVALYYNGSEKLQTLTAGVDVTGNITVSGTVDGRDVATDGTKLDGIESGATADQTASEILTLIKTVDGSGSGLDADTLDGQSIGAFLRSNAATTKTSGNLNFSDDIRAVFGAGSDLQIYHNSADGDSRIFEQGSGQLNIDGSNLKLRDSNGNNYLQAVDNGTGGTITLYHNAAAKLATKSDGVDITGELQSDSLDVDGNGNISGTLTMGGNIDLQDSDKIILGSSDDFEMQHNGTATFLDQVGTGHLRLRNLTNDADVLLETDDGSGGTTTYVQCDGSNGEVRLYHYGSEKFNTVSGGVYVTGDIQVSSGRYEGASSGDYISIGASDIDFYINSSNEFRMQSDGDFHADADVIAYSTTVSDERLKTDIKKIENATDKVSQLNGYTFTYKADGKKSAGVIAQEVEKVLPSAVREKELPLKMDDGVAYKTVQYDQIIGLLIESIKELKQEINDLKGV